MISPHILVVGSDPAILRTVTAMLAQTSCRAEETAIGADAVAKVHAHPAPDLVLLEFGNGNHAAGLQDGVGEGARNRAGGKQPGGADRSAS